MSDDTHRLTGELNRNGERYEPGDTLTPTDAELTAYPDRFEPIDSSTESEAESESDAEAEAEAEGEAESEDETEHPSPEEFTDMSVSDYRSYVREHDLATEQLEAMLEAEQDRDSTRSTVTSLLEDELEDDEDEDDESE